MLRLFRTHQVRREEELTEQLWEMRIPRENGENVCMQVLLPGCVQNIPGFENYRGRASFETEFTARGGRIRIVCKGVSHTARVYVDGQEIGGHYNAYTPFALWAGRLTPGKHRLRIDADNGWSDRSALHVPNDYESYLGVIRPVSVEETGDVLIEYLHLTPGKRDGSWFVDAETIIRNLGEEPFRGSVTLSIGGNHRKEIRLAGAESLTVRWPGLAVPDAQEWSPEDPRLTMAAAVVYDAEGRPVDDLTERFGLRQVEIRGGEILLNGRPIKIRGFCRHEDDPQFGCAMPVSAMARDLALIRDLGGNSVRAVHYPNDERFLDLCDETGMLVWEENHARGLSEEQMRNPCFEPQAEECIREMIREHYNHPCIYIWGILNECAGDTEYGMECYARQLELVRSLDASRPRSFASCQWMKERCFGLADVVAFNMYPRWYIDRPVRDYLEELYAWIRKAGGEGKPFLITETGAGALYGFRSPRHEKWSEEYQREALEEQLTAVLGFEGCNGVYIWQFADCRVCGEWFATRPRTMNNKGIVDEYRRPKLSYETVRRILKGE